MSDPSAVSGMPVSGSSRATRAEAERYGEYITAVLRPLSVAGTVGSAVSDETLEEHLAPSWG
jgi:hypothetical protein